MTIYDIKREVESTEGDHYYFTRKTMKYFGQRLRDFKVNKIKIGVNKGNFILYAPSYFDGRKSGYSVRMFVPETKKLETALESDLIDMGLSFLIRSNL